MSVEIPNLEIITPPAEEPVSLDDVKDFIRYEDTLQDSYITALIPAARRQVEQWTNRTLINTDFKYYVTAGYCFPRVIQLPISTVIEAGLVVQYLDCNDTLQTVDASVYKLDNKSMINSIYERYNECFPTDVMPESNSIIISLTAGFGVDRSFVPSNYKQAILLICSYMFEMRDAYIESDMRNNPALQKMLGIGASYRFG